MIAHVRVQRINGKDWWWFFTTPLVYSVYWLPDGSKTVTEFRDEQLAAVRKDLRRQVSA